MDQSAILTKLDDLLTKTLATVVEVEDEPLHITRLIALCNEAGCIDTRGLIDGYAQQLSRGVIRIVTLALLNTVMRREPVDEVHGADFADTFAPVSFYSDATQRVADALGKVDSETSYLFRNYPLLGKLTHTLLDTFFGINVCFVLDPKTCKATHVCMLTTSLQTAQH